MALGVNENVAVNAEFPVSEESPTPLSRLSATTLPTAEVATLAI